MSRMRNFLRKRISDNRWKNYQLIKKVGDKKYEPYPFVAYVPYFEWDFEPTEHPQYCSHFGCGKTLSPTEQLFGNCCISHQPNSAPSSLIEKYI